MTAIFTCYVGSGSYINLKTVKTSKYEKNVEKRRKNEIIKNNKGK